MDDHLATLIAAGELVAETGSVVRELVDNALEALNLLDDRQRRLSEKKRSAVSRRPSVTDS